MGRWTIITGWILIYVLLSVSGGIAQGETAPAAASDTQLISALEAAWAEGGEVQLRAFVRSNTAVLSEAVIRQLAKQGGGDRSDYLRGRTKLEIAGLAAAEQGNKQLQADIWLMMGENFCNADEDGRAEECLDRVMPLYEQLGDLSGRGNVLLLRGRILFWKEDYEQALSACQAARALFVATGNLEGQGKACQKMARNFIRLGDNSEADIMFEQARQLFEKSGNQSALGNFYLERGEEFYFHDDNDQAMAMYSKALSCFKAANDLVGQGDAYWNQGEVFRFKGNNIQALDMLEHSLRCFEQANDLRGQGKTYRLIGNVYSYTGNVPKAQANFEKALVCCRNTSFLFDLASLCVCYGDMYFNCGENAKALALYDDLIKLGQKLNSPRFLGVGYARRGEVLLRIGDYPEARTMFEKSLPLFEKSRDSSCLAITYYNLGDYFHALGADREAIPLYEKALALETKAGYTIGQGNQCHLLGEAYLGLGDKTQALAMYDQALALFEKANYPIGLGKVYLGQGDLLLSEGKTAQALAMYEKSAEFYTQCSDPDGLARTFFREARVLADFQKPRQALERYEKALELLENIRRHIGTDQFKQGFLETMIDNYTRAAAFMLKNGYPEAAFRTTERMKARLFLDHLTEGAVDLAKGISPVLKAERDRIEGHLQALREQKGSLYGGPLSTMERENQLAALAAEISADEKALTALKISIRLQNPLYALVEYPTVPEVKKLQQTVLKAGETLLEYYLGPQEAWCFVMSRDEFAAVKLPAQRPEIDTHIESLGTRYRAGLITGKTDEGKWLYDVLIRPLEKRLKGRTLIIVPDGKLARLPFELLEKGEGDQRMYLLERFDVKYIQSAAVLAFYRTKIQRREASARFFGVGDPVYDFENFKSGKPEQGMAIRGDGLLAGMARRAMTRRGQSLARLPGTGEEVCAIGALFQAKRCPIDKKLREQAREEAVKASDLSECGYIHLAAHGILEDSFQAIALSQIPGGSDDGLLSLGEIMNLHWNARLVVLSACETGLGRMERGEGLTGLTRAVMYAGAPAVVASLWSVSDEGTKDLMIRFYRKMLEERLPPATALKAAKLEMLGRGSKSGQNRQEKVSHAESSRSDFTNPFFWAGFVLYGE